MSNHPITPPPELVEQWYDRSPGTSDVQLAAKSAQWGADQELEAIIEWMKRMGFWGEDGQAIPLLRAARRPKPPSLKEQALEIIKRGEDDWQPLPEDWDTIRRALEAL